MWPDTPVSVNLLGEPLEGYFMGMTARKADETPKALVCLEGGLIVDLPEEDLQVRDKGRTLAPKEDG